MNTTTGTQTIRSNIFARSCNDDYCPAMEELCVKMSMLSLSADPKMDAYDAKLEQFFYEEKEEVEDNDIDEKNQETFVDNDESDYEAEVNEFNERYGTCFGAEQLVIFKQYQANNHLKIWDAIEYIQSCHKCDSFLTHFGNEYCNERCCEYVEDYRYPCFRGEDCLICYGYPKTTCYWARKGCVECDTYSGPEEDRYPYDCFYCLTQMTDHEGYNIDNEIYCNNCAADLFDKRGHLDDQDNDDQDNDDQDNDDQDNDDQDNDDSKKRRFEPEDDDEECDSKRQRVDHQSRDQINDLTQESYDIWDLALDINHGDKEAALQMIEDQERLRSHPRVIEYYRAKEADAEECSSEYSEESEQDYDLQERKLARHIHFEDSDAEDDDLPQKKRARHIRFEDVDEDDNEMDLDISDAESECERCPEVMVIDLLNESDDDEDDTDYDYAESVVDDDSECEEEIATKTVTMAEAAVSSMVTMIQELQEENAALRAELELLQSQRRMLFPEGSSISITEEDGLRYINVHSQAPRGNHSHMFLSDLDCHNDYSDTEDDFAMDEDM